MKRRRQRWSNSSTASTSAVRYGDTARGISRKRRYGIRLRLVWRKANGVGKTGCVGRSVDPWVLRVYAGTGATVLLSCIRRALRLLVFRRCRRRDGCDSTACTTCDAPHRSLELPGMPVGRLATVSRGRDDGIVGRGKVGI